jgi:glycerate 2-kinase
MFWLNAAPSASAWIRAGMRGEHPETPKPGDPAFTLVRHTIVGNNSTAVDAAAAKARDLGFTKVASRLAVQGEASVAGRGLGSARFAAEHPSAIVWGGETTVTVGPATGRGGRNQEAALAAALEIDVAPNIAIATFATDGVDGPTDAAGAVVTGETCGLARAAGLDPGAALKNHDSYTFFAALDAAYPDRPPHLIRTGPTGTNVNDVAVALVY